MRGREREPNGHQGERGAGWRDTQRVGPDDGHYGEKGAGWRDTQRGPTGHPEGAGGTPVERGPDDDSEVKWMTGSWREGAVRTLERGWMTGHTMERGLDDGHSEREWRSGHYGERWGNDDRTLREGAMTDTSERREWMAATQRGNG